MTNKELLKENAFLKQKIRELEQSESERKHADASLQESDERFKKLFDHMADGVAVYQEVDDGQDFVFVDINRTGQILSKMRLDEAVGRRVTEVFPSVERMGLLDVFRRVCRTGQPEHYPLTEYVDDRIVQWVENYVFRLQSGLIATIYSDTSEKHRVEELLRRSEENFRRSFDDSPLGVRIVTEEGETIYVNRAILNIYGYDSLEDFRTIPVKKRYTQECYADYLIRREKRQQGIDTPPEYEISIVRKDGEICHLKVFRKEILWDGKIQFQVIYNDITERKKMEEALKRSEEKYRTLFEAQADAVLIVDEETADIIDANKSACQLYGYSYEEITALKANDFSAEPEKTMITIRVPGKSFIPVRYHRKKDGTVFIVEIASNDYEFNGRRTNVSIIRDITERKQADDALRKSQEQLKEAHRLAHIGVWNWVAETDTVLWTEELYHIAGLDPMLPAPTYAEHANIYAPESWDLLKEGVERAMKTGEPYQLELKLIRPDGTTRWVNAFGGSTYDSHGLIQGLYGTLQDITERKRMEERLKESEERYRSLFENSIMGISQVLPDGRLVLVNSAYSQMYGFANAEEMMAAVTHVGQFYANPDDREKVLRILKENGVMKPREIAVIRRDGTRFIVLAGAREIRDSKGKPLYYQAEHIDITDRKQAEEKLEASQKQLRDLAERLQQIREEERLLVSREIHDIIGGGLTGLKMDLSWLIHNLKNAESDKEQAAFKSRIVASSEFVDQMIKDTRRISTGLRPPFIDDLGLISAIDWELSEFTSRTGILHELTTTFEYVNMEKEKAVGVFRIFQEMLTNIVRHSRATKVVVILREDERSLFGDENLVLEIRDNGRGITEEEILNSKSLGLLGMKERTVFFGEAPSTRS